MQLPWLLLDGACLISTCLVITYQRSRTHASWHHVLILQLLLSWLLRMRNHGTSPDQYTRLESSPARWRAADRVLAALASGYGLCLLWGSNSCPTLSWAILLTLELCTSAAHDLIAQQERVCIEWTNDRGLHDAVRAVQRQRRQLQKCLQLLLR